MTHNRATGLILLNIHSADLNLSAGLNGRLQDNEMLELAARTRDNRSKYRISCLYSKVVELDRGGNYSRIVTTTRLF